MKINRNILIHSTILIGLLSYLVFVMFRFVPSFKHAVFHTVYLCQTFLQNIPSGIVFLFGIAVLYAILQLMISQYRGYTLKKTFRYQKHKPLILNRLENLYELKNKIILLNDKKPLAFCMGIFTPKIYLSSGLLKIMNNKELEAVILHEKYHMENKDNLFLVGLHFLKNLLFFFPFTRDLVHNFEQKEEIYADQKAAREIGTSSVVAALKKMFVYNDNNQYALSFSKSKDIEARIYNLIGKSHSRLPIQIKNIAISIASFGVFMILSSIPVSSTEVTIQGKDVVMMCIGNQSCEYRCQQEQLFFTPIKRSS